MFALMCNKLFACDTRLNNLFVYLIYQSVHVSNVNVLTLRCHSCLDTHGSMAAFSLSASAALSAINSVHISTSVINSQSAQQSVAVCVLFDDMMLLCDDERIYIVGADALLIYCAHISLLVSLCIVCVNINKKLFVKIFSLLLMSMMQHSVMLCACMCMTSAVCLGGVSGITRHWVGILDAHFTLTHYFFKTSLHIVSQQLHHHSTASIAHIVINVSINQLQNSQINS